MFSLTTTGVAVSFAFFMFRSCVATIAEYMPLFMAQLGYSTTYVGLVPVLGFVTQVIGIPIAGYLSDKFRMRKHLLLICILLSIPSTLLFLAPKAPDLTCEESSSGNITESFGNSSIVHNSVMNASSAEKNVENPLGNSETKYDGDMNTSILKNGWWIMKKSSRSCQNLIIFLSCSFARMQVSVLRFNCVGNFGTCGTWAARRL
ncbi:uncharacterized protein LOC114543413 [Dendronephthya gigantea]|uniref:uncharacterized protein LOC114543413 n=1 Tax=Dendronephthya gigantea TaxID=151771 RepID=UPI00106B1FD2|nr:uncharacterized protein LOC114543413 [Dendronephthya gigantea]